MTLLKVFEHRWLMFEYKYRKHTSCPFKHVPNANKNVKRTWGGDSVPERGLGTACRALRKTWFSEELYFSWLAVTYHFLIDALHSSTLRQALEHWDLFWVIKCKTAKLYVKGTLVVWLKLFLLGQHIMTKDSDKTKILQSSTFFIVYIY